MADTSSAPDLRFLTSGASAKRSTPNVSSGWVAMLLSGLIAFVLFVYLTQQSSQSFPVAAVTQDLTAGTPVGLNNLRQVEVNVERPQRDRLVPWGEVSGVEGFISSGSLQAGDLLQRSDVREPAARDGRRAMSVPVDRARAVGGALRSGDRIDIINANNGTFVVQDIEVLNTDTDTGGIGGSGNFSFTVAVTATQATDLSPIIQAGRFDVVRSTGADPLPAPTGTTTTTEGQ